MAGMWVEAGMRFSMRKPPWTPNRRDRLAAFVDERVPRAMRGIIRVGSVWAGVLTTRERTFRTDDDVAIETHPGVAPPVIPIHRDMLAGINGHRVLDVGCGSGYLTALAARGGAVVTAIDINEKALTNTLANAEALGVRDRVTAGLSDVLDDVQGNYDYVIANPPWFEHPLGEKFRATSSPRFLPKLFSQSGSVIAPGGELRIFIPRFRLIALSELGRRHGWGLTAVKPVRRSGSPLVRWLRPVPLVLPAMAVATFRRSGD
jgi:protein-L-isoaspartate O-methyltransferase